MGSSICHLLSQEINSNKCFLLFTLTASNVAVIISSIYNFFFNVGAELVWILSLCT